MDKREAFVWYLEQHIGTWYSWGGDDPSGIDCSGFVVEGLQAVGVLPRKGDWNAHALMQAFPVVNASGLAVGPRLGDLVFWLNETGKAIHVECVWRLTDLGLGASGGGSKTITKEDAIRDNAFVKIRPIASRGGVVVYCDPFTDGGAL